MTEPLKDHTLRLAIQLVGENIGRENLYELLTRSFNTLASAHHSGYECGYSVGYKQAQATEKQWKDGLELFNQREAERTAIEDEELYKAAAALDMNDAARIYQGDSGDEDDNNDGC